ncbi:hypothetical protein HJC23_005299 [Cyclotella cryptica]|uniref:CDP-alcohol phosphatidyltransferase n=1 Tax=Cyclotella cryptica TaxID=29204 RepID=A0ABD3PHI0_9STRA|eukprot:CCRYP_015056-RB/>CCRYP_015056-RB protein AED:0.04 eAED:0.04 QI:143/1/1/1/0.33/0.25/4/858/418
MHTILRRSRRYSFNAIIPYDTRVDGGALIKPAFPSCLTARSVGKCSMRTLSLRVSTYWRTPVCQGSTSVCQTVAESRYAITSKMYHSRSSRSIQNSLMLSNEFGLGSTRYRVYSSSGPANEPASQKPTGSMSNLQTGSENQTKDDTKGGQATPINQRAAVAILKQLTSPPNILTLSRIMATPYLSYLLIYHHRGKVNASSNIDSAIDLAAADAATTAATDTFSCVAANIDPSSTPVVALSLFLAMGFTDYLDGYIARRFPSTATILGTYLDPFADKVFISVMSLTLWYIGNLPGLLVGLWVARDVGMLGSAYWMVRAETLKRNRNNISNSGTNDAEKSIAIMDPTNTPLKVQANFLSKVNTSLQILLIALGIAGEVPAVNIPPELLTSLCWVTAGTTIGSSAMYLDGSALLKSGNRDS